MLDAVEFVMTDVVGELTLLGDVEFVTRGEFGISSRCVYSRR